MSAGNSITLVCTHCLKFFTRFASNVKVGQRPFCSRLCKDDLQRYEGLIQRRETTWCPQCGVSMDRPRSTVRPDGKHFCNRICSQIYYADIQARFWERVYVKGPQECWPWLGAIDPNFGYGAFPYGKSARLVLPFTTKSKQVATHRIAYFLHNGRIDLSLNTCHTCDNPPCCNPLHLFEGTQADNIHDMFEKRRDRWSRYLTELQRMERNHA